MNNINHSGVALVIFHDQISLRVSEPGCKEALVLSACPPFTHVYFILSFYGDLESTLTFSFGLPHVFSLFLAFAVRLILSVSDVILTPPLSV